MKFLTIAAICAFASSVSSLKITNHLFQNSQSLQDWHSKAPQKDSDQSTKIGKPQLANINPKEGQTGRWEDRFDWKTWQNPCPNKDDKTCWKQWFSSQLTCRSDDKQCWGDYLKKLPCPLVGQSCWTDHIDTFPCKEGDSACWNQILPSNLPCKSDDGACWAKLRSKDGKGENWGAKRHQVNSYLEEDQESFGLSSLFNENEDKHMIKNYEDLTDQEESYGLDSLFGEEGQSHLQKQQKEENAQNNNNEKEKGKGNGKGKGNQNKDNKQNKQKKDKKEKKEKKDKKDKKDKTKKSQQDPSSDDKTNEQPINTGSSDSTGTGTTTPSQN